MPGVHELFRAQAARTPEGVAVDFEDGQLSYAALDLASDRLAAVLRSKGVRPEYRVGLMMGRSAELVIATLAILKAGGAYVPLSSEDPPSRTSGLLTDTQACLLLVDEGTAGRAAADYAGEVLMFAEAMSAPDQPTDRQPSFRGADQGCYVMFTSGSTGRPKGVVITHRNVQGLALDPVWRSYRYERVLGHSPHNFDASTMELWVPLLSGGTVVLAPPGRLEPRDLGRTIRDKQVTAGFFTTALFNLLCADHLDLLREMKAVWTGGEAASTPAMRRAREALSGTDLVHVYGPTECTTFATYHLVARDHPGDKTVPIGTAMSDKGTRVLGPGYMSVSDGAAGELYIAGGGLARGYLNQPGLTAESFVPDPKGSPGSRMYRTGDVVTQRPDAAIEFIGRSDDQVKIRGFRIEPDEVTAVLACQPGVAEAFVVARDDAIGGGKRLVAYVVPRKAAEISPKDLRAAVEARLSAYMVPEVVILQVLPLSPNGKVDRTALPAPAPRVRVTAEAPGSAAEQAVAEVFAELLETGPLGPPDDFFALGGDSLLAMRAAARLRGRLGTGLSLVQMFADATVRGTARACESAPAASDPINRVNRGDPLPASSGQARLWYMEQASPGDPLHVLPFALRLTGRLSEDALLIAVNSIVERHEALRTRIVAVDGAPQQMIDDDVRLPPLSLADLSSLSRGEAFSHAREMAAEQGRRAFDLARSPLLRCHLIRIAADEHILLLTLHHIAADAWSVTVLARELSGAYAAAAAGRPPRLPPLLVQYADFARWQDEKLTEGRLADGLRFWRGHLAGSTPLELPADWPRTGVSSSVGAVIEAHVDGRLARSLRALGRQNDATLFMVLLASFHVLLARFAGRLDVVTGSPVAGRTHPDVEDLVGFFAQTVALRSVIDPDASFAQVLTRLRETTVAGLDHQDIPFDRVVEHLAPRRGTSVHPVFQVMFVMQNGPAQRWALSDLTVEELRFPEPTSRFDLTLYVEPAPQGLNLRFVYAKELFSAGTVRTWADSFVRLLESVADDSDRRVSGIELAGAQDLQRIADWNNTASSPSGRWLPAHRLVQAAAEQAPGAVAVIGGDRRLTYDELQQRADRLARLLNALGVNAEDRVVLHVRRGPDLVVGMLGILMAGAVYVPLDPDQPTERVQDLLSRIGPCVVVTESSAPPPAARGSSGTFVFLDKTADPHSMPPASAADGRLWSLRAEPSPDSAAYLIYTSGSTGEPKGVVGTHAGLANYLVHAVGDYGLRLGDRVLQLASPAYDASLRDILGPLVHGATVVFLEPDAPKTPETVREAIREHGITAVLSAVPSMIREFKLLSDPAAPTLRLVATSGESARLAGQWSPDNAPRLLNQYGPTECAMTTTVAESRGQEAVSDVVGLPIANTRVHILDTEFHPVPPGVVGDVYIAGAGLARGYQDRPALTASVFLPDPFGPPGCRMYRAGDRARRSASGALELRGRADRQAKIRGNRVEPAEIERALEGHPDVAKAAVVVSEPPDVRLLAYVEREVGTGRSPTSGALRRHLGLLLPEFMVPASVAVLAELPVTISGKIDRQGLSQLPAWSDRMAETLYVAPRSSNEQRVADIWSEVLGVERVGVHDNFFELGGHSLLATRVVARLGRRYAVRITVRDFLDAPTVEGGARCIERAYAARMDRLFGQDRA